MRILPDHYIQITDTIIGNSKVNNNIKIVASGDYHLSRIMGQEKLDVVKYQLTKENGDYYVLLGDLFDSPKEVNKKEKQKEFLNLLTTIANFGPTMVILGSHDFVDEDGLIPEYSYNAEFWNKIAQMPNVYLLNNAIYKDKNVFFMGYIQTLNHYCSKNNPRAMDQQAFYDDLVKKENLYKNIPQDVPAIGLIHSPEYANDFNNMMLLKDYDLLLGGHDHDGCIPLGLGTNTRGIISPKIDWFPENVRGVRRLDSGTIMIINGGIVKIQDCAPKVLHWLNHLCPMQIDTIKLVKSDEQFIESQKRNVYTRVRKR